MGKDYYLGLDMGTGTLGWAVTDDNYEILRKHGKALWGVRLFETANTAEERRMFRTSRRRLERRNWRIRILQEIFAEEISKVDSGFYLRMKESKYYPEDKRQADGNCPDLPYALFVDSDFTDKEYHKQFPTIYHLRKYLMETEKTPDIRLVYLAFHHMMKHRGHFLLSGDIEKIKDFQSTFEQFLTNVINEELNFHLQFDVDQLKKVETILSNRDLGRATKKTKLVKELGAKTTCEKAILSLLAGSTVKLSDIFENENLEGTERPKISFADSGYDDYKSTIEADLAEQYYIIESAKAVYDWSILVDLLGEHTSISEAKVATFEKHKFDLSYLKQLVKEHLTKEDYKELFVKTDTKSANYCAYIGMTKVNGKKVALERKQCGRDEFRDFLRKNVVKKINNPDVTKYLEEELEKESFLPKQVTKDNGVLPYQLHLYEMKKIIDNLEDRIPFLKEQKEKIISLFQFRIPYYVGPLNTNSNAFSWAVRRNQEKIYPWNFEDVVDVEASAEQFVRKMTNKCTYLFGEDVLPKDSLLYSKYVVLNELNNLRINGEKISVTLKQDLYENLFCRSRKVTQKKLKTYLIKEGIVDKSAEITGIDGDFKGTLTAYHDFKEKLTDSSLTIADKEEIILNIVLFGDDKKLLKQRLSKKFPDLTDGQKKAICSLSYKGWGRLSKKFLEEVTIPAPETGEVWNVITALWETNDNLMQLLSKEYSFVERIEEYNDSIENPKLTYQTVEDLYVSPSVKRQIWQTLTVIKEIKKVMGCDPKRVFIEMAREKQESKRTESRKKQLVDLYKACKKEERDWIAELMQTEEPKLRSDKLYLYYTQKGRCMYSGEAIDLEDLWDNTKYDIDHIYPQSKTMDDSLNNRVLVKKQCNAEKSDEYPIKKEIRKKMTPFWKLLLDCKLITKEKYERLVRSTEFDANELARFIERQIVETRQGTKAVADILKKVFQNTEIVYAKAKNVSHFRQQFDLLKVRELNDLHHAKDAYLNIVVGNTYFVKFTKNAAWFVRENPGRTYNLQKMFTSKYDVERNGEVAWKAGNQGTIVTVKKYMQKNNILVTRRSYEVKGELFDQQLMKKGKGQVPIKGSDERLQQINKYGGYNKATGTYFMLVESKDKKGNAMRTIEYVPLYLKKRIEESIENAIVYLKEERQLSEPKILIPKIKINTLFKVDGFQMWLSGRTGNQLIFKCANQLILSKEEELILKSVIAYVKRRKDNKNAVLGDKTTLTEELLVKLYDVFLNKLKNTVYQKRLSSQINTLESGRDKFMVLSKEDKCVVLEEILHLFQCQSNTANLTTIGGAAQSGSIKIGNNISRYKHISVIYTSPTGIFENEVDLLRV